jgi:selenocysteine lyase/cysteine desulfurase
VRSDLLDRLPNQGHFFNAHRSEKRLAPAGPDHAQEAAAGGVLDYVELLHRHHGGSVHDDLRTAAATVSSRWRRHEDALTEPLLAALRSRDDVRLLGPRHVDVRCGAGTGHRCPTVAFVPLRDEPADVARGLVERGVQTSAGNFYAYRVLEGLGVDPERGVVRLSAVHYTSPADVDRAVEALGDVLG